jgi:hypothetical protein
MSKQEILNELEERIGFHLRWSRVWSYGYFTIAASSVTSAALASASAGFITSTGEGKMLTAGLALAATVLTSLEKVLKVREKWDLHRNSQVALRIVKLRMLAENDEDKAFVDQIAKVSESYSLQLGELNKAPSTKETGE